MHRILMVILLVLGVTGAAPAEAGWEEGVAAFQGGNFSQAAREFQAVVEAKPDWAGGRYMLGQSLLRLDRNEEAVTELRKAYDLSPDEVSYRLALSGAYLAVRRYADAANLLGKINPASFSAATLTSYYQMAAMAYEKSGQDARALDALRRLAGVRPDDADIQFRYGMAALNAGEVSSAVRALEKAVRLAPDDLEKKAAYVQVLKRQAGTQRGDNGLSTFRKALPVAIDLAGRQSTYGNLITLGEVQLGAREYGDAASTFAEATAKNGESWLAHYYLGQARSAIREYKEADQALRKAVDMASVATDKQAVWRQIGFVNEKLQNYAAAKDAYGKAGDAAGLARLEENERTAASNSSVEEENARIKAMQEEAKRLEEELKELEGGGGPHH